MKTLLAFVMSLLVSTTFLSSNLVQLGPPSWTVSSEIEPISRTRRIINGSIVNTLSGLSSLAIFGFKNYDKILSKKFAAALIIAGAPYLYFSDKELLSSLSEYMADFAFKMSGSIADGTLKAIMNNPEALSKIVAALTVSQAGGKIVEKVGIKLAEVFLTIITMGTIK